jgi:hypothetical protein
MDQLSGTSLAETDSPAALAESPQSAVSWGAILCGAVVAAAVSLILLALGSAMNLASISPWAGVGASVTTFTVMTAIWFIVTQWVAAGVGGYLTGRLRTKWVSLHTHEVFFRDTAHGFVTWAVATLVSVAFVAATALSLLSSGAHASGAAAAEMVRGASANSGVGAYDLDTLFRGTAAAGAGADLRPEVTRIIANGLTGNGVPDADRSYLSSLVASRTGVSAGEAEQRVNVLIARSRETADRARKASAQAAFATALSMLIGAFVACTAAALGGRRRDAADLLTAT